MGELLYYGTWFFKSKFLGQRKPLQSVLFITDRCNLNCKHCNVVKEGPECISKSYEEVKAELEYCYELGSRIVDFEGGEPQLWTDGDKDINSLIELARQIGYYSITVTTNAMLPITAKSDLIWISIDGMQKKHDEQRAAGSFERALKNIAACDHPNMNVNMTITSKNYEDFEAVAQMVKENPHLRRLSFSFYMPYENRDLCVTPEIRNSVIDTALRLKKEGHDIMNSNAGLKLLRDPKSFAHKRQCWISNFILSDGTRLDECPGAAGGLCEECGFGMGAEMTLLWKLHPAMLKAGLSVRS
ncbi:MAG: radical SAM protein [Coriobacteriia bacterium]|jgi:MoaA/NifB/PqqE/SkfB family radical SAM enzyme|nr:radical SAM protein [Coriobacteriia bacterium]MDR2714706.1 radical SAM protein [Coriobacteriales bacterium]